MPCVATCSCQVEDVARAFDCVLHRGVTGKIYNIGGTHEKANIEVAKDVIRVMKLDKKEVRGCHVLFNITLYVPGRRSEQINHPLMFPPKR